MPIARTLAVLIVTALPALYAEELPRHVAIPDQAVGDLHMRAMLNLQPRMAERRTASPDAVLTGAESYTLDFFRTYATNLHAIDGFYPRTSAEALEAVTSAADFGLVWRVQVAQTEQAGLMMNWAFATLMGQSDLAATYLSELSTFRLALLNQEISTSKFIFASESELADLFDTSIFNYPLYAKYHASILHGRAISVRDFAELLTDEADPQGYIRQRLNKAHDDLILLADLITSLGGE